VFEDMQWADEALLSFVEYLMEWSRDHGLFVLALARPELADRRPGWGATSRSLTSLALEPLGAAAMAELVSGMVPGLPATAAARIAAAAEGVPLYAVETARMLLDRGLLVRAADGGGYGVTGDIAEIEIPETLHALVAARLDGLSEEERRLLQQAAVLGKSFSPEGLAAVSGRPREQVDEALTTLARKELVSVQTDPRSPERGQYGFVQDMVRTIARDTLGRRERKRLHLATAEHLRRQGGDELAEVIAAHRVDAYRLLPDDPDAADLRDAARTDLLVAADRAGSLGAPAEALRLVSLALELAPEGAGQAELHERAGSLALQKGDVDDAEAQYARALEIHERGGDPHSAARVRARRGDVLFLQGRAEQAVAEMEEAYAVLADGPPDADLAHLGAQVGRLCGMIGDEARGRAALERAIDISEELGLPEVLSNALNTKGLWIIAFTHRREEGRSLLLGALRVALDAGETQAAMRAYFNLSFEREGVDDYSHSYDTDGLALAERVGDEQWKRSFLLHTSFAALESGDWDGALQITYEAEDTPGAESDIFARGILLTRANVLSRRGSVAAARAAIEAAGFDESVSDEQNRAGLRSARAEVLAAEGRYAEAAAAARRGAEAAATLWLGHPAVKMSIMLETWCALRAGDRVPAEAAVERLTREPLGRLSPRLGAHRALLQAMLAAPGDAPTLHAEAVAAARRAGSPWQLAMALAEQANAGIDADAALAELRAILERLGAQAALERLVPDASPARAAAAT
jgi:tetratricopeptide (TPR) repeat protein